MASSLEAGGMAILQACAQAPDTWRPHGAASALVAKTVAALGLDMRLGTARERTRDKQSVAVFAATRDALAGLEKFDYPTLSAVTGNSPRSIQLAFAGHFLLRDHVLLVQSHFLYSCQECTGFHPQQFSSPSRTVDFPLRLF